MLSEVGTIAAVDISVDAFVIGVRVGVGIDTFTVVPINVFAGVVVGMATDVLVGEEFIVVVASAVIVSEVVVSASYAVDVLLVDMLTTVYTGVKTVIVFGINVDMLVDVDVNVLRAVMIALIFIVPVL